VVIFNASPLNFIANIRGKNLKERIITLYNKSDELKFLLRFFFLKIKELYTGLKSKRY